MTLTKGQEVRYTFYGKPETATVDRVSANGAIVWLDNGRWMHAESLTPVNTYRCDQCEALMINGVFCHETGCPNSKARYDEESGTWIKQYKCFTCGYMADEGSDCCEPCEDDEEPIDDTPHYIAGSGSHGCLYDSCSVYDTYQDAVDGLAETFELGRTRKARLFADGSLELKPKDGAEYCEIVECDCGNASQHQD